MIPIAMKEFLFIGVIIPSRVAGTSPNTRSGKEILIALFSSSGRGYARMNRATRRLVFGVATMRERFPDPLPLSDPAAARLKPLLVPPK